MRMKNSHLIGSFAKWQHFAKERVHVRFTMTKYLRAIVRADEVQAMVQWKRYSNWYERHAHEQDTHDLTLKIHSLEDELHECQAELEEFRAVFNRKRDKFVLALSARVEHERMRTSYYKWRNLAHSRHSARRTITRLLNKQLASAWHSWVAHDAALREELHIRTMAAAERSRERERKKVVLNRTLKHMQQLKLSSSFRSWKTTIDEYIHTRFVMNRFVARWRNMDLHRNFSQWVQFTITLLHQKKTARKVLNRIARNREVAAWSKWVHAVEMLREHDKEAQEAERKKAHDDLVLERFVRRWRSMDLHTRFQHWKENWRSEKHKKITQQQLAELRSEYEAKIGGLQAARDAEREYRVKKTLAAWLNNNLMHCFHRWQELASRNMRERNVVAKFVLHWQKGHLVSAYRSWVYKIRHLKRSRRIVANMRASRGRRELMKLFRAWCKVSAETAKDRRLLKRFGQRWKNLELTRVWLSWHDYVGLRKHARDLVNMFFSRWQNSKLSKGFRAWSAYSLRYEAYQMTEKLKADAMLQKHKTAAADLQAKQHSAHRMLRHMMQRNLAAVFRTWSHNVSEIVRVREVVRSIGVRMMKSGMVRAYAKWVGVVDDRNLARRVLTNLIHGKLVSAWKTWIRYSDFISKWTANSAIKKVEELTIALNRIRKRSVRTLLWDRYKEVMGTAMHAWYLTIVQHRENEHLRLEEAEHQRLEAALARESAEHQKYEAALAKGHDQEEALINLENGLKKVREMTAEEHRKYEEARKHELDEHHRLEEALAREAAEHQKYEEAMALGHDKEEALAKLEKGLLKAKKLAETEHLKYVEEHKKLEESKKKPKGRLARALISSVWHKHKTNLRVKDKEKHAMEMKRQRDEAMRRLEKAKGKVVIQESGMSAWAIARAGVRGIKGKTAGRVSPTVSTLRTASPIPGQKANLFSVVASAAGSNTVTGGRMVQRTLEDLNDLVHTLTTATDVETQCMLLRAIATKILRADNVDMFIKGQHTFWTMVPSEIEFKGEDKVLKKQKWPLNAKGGMVAMSLLQGHIVDSENALMDDCYCASPDLSPSGNKHRTVSTIAVLVVPLMDRHGKTMGAIRVSRGRSSNGPEDSFSSVESLLLCIIAAIVQCTWNFVGGPGSIESKNAMVHVVQPEQKEVEESKELSNSSTTTAAAAVAAAAEIQQEKTRSVVGWEKILRDAIIEFDRSHAGVVSRLGDSVMSSRSLPRAAPQGYSTMGLHGAAVSQRPSGPLSFMGAIGGGGQSAFRPHHDGAASKRTDYFLNGTSGPNLHVGDLLTNFTPAVRPGHRGVVSFVSHNFHDEY